MPRAIRSAGQIRQIVRDRVHQLDSVRNRGVEITVPLPVRTEPDATGCNWSIWFAEAEAADPGIAEIMERAKGEVNLNPE